LAYELTTEEPDIFMNIDRTKDLLKKYHEECFRWATYCCSGNQTVSRDIMQNVYLKVLEGNAIYRENSDASFRTWIFSVIKFTCLDYFRSENKYQLNAEIPVADYNSSEDESEPVNSESGELLKEMLKQLSPKQNEVLRLVFYHNLTIEEASGVMGVSVGTSRTHYERGKTNLKKLIESQDLKIKS